ncbi:MAG: hypothetical protein ACKO2P_17400 [Planctomycetota bacterium]
MSPRSRREFEQQLQDSPAGLAVFDALMQSNVNITEVPVEFLQEMLCEEWQRRRLRGRPQLRVFRGDVADFECGSLRKAPDTER